jgi:tetratricopeptide (TPR) repeat protein
VRSVVAEIAAGLPAPPGTEEAPGFPVLRLLLSDPDLAVKNRAAALLSRMDAAMAPPSPAEKQAAAAAEKSLPVPPPAPAKEPETKEPETKGPETKEPEAKEPETKEPETKEDTPEPAAEAAPGNGSLLLLAPEGTLYQIDDGKWQTAPEKGKPISLAQGEHRVTTMGGDYKVLVEAGKKAQLTLIASPIDEAVQFGSRAYQQKDYAKAIKLYDRASTLCGRDRTHKKACLTLELGLALDRGRSYEALARYGEAMTEYQKAVDGTRGKTRVQAADAMSRLSPQLGRVILRSVVSGKCQERVQWLVPGKKQWIKVGNKSQSVNVAAGNTIEFGECP